MKTLKTVSSKMRVFIKFLSLLGLFSLQFLCGLGQQENIKDTSTLFYNGIYIQNLQINIPWTLDLSDLSAYGNPKILHQTRIRSNLVWDSVNILNGIECKMSCFVDNKS